MNSKLKKLVYCAVLAAISIILVYFVRFPIFPAAPFLEYDAADVPILFGTFALGTTAGLALTIIVSVLQGILVSAQSGWVGIVMHMIATGAFVIVAGSLYKKDKTAENTIFSLFCGAATMILTMIPLNLIFSSFFYIGVPLNVSFSETVRALISFPNNIWGVVTGAAAAAVGTFALFCAISRNRNRIVPQGEKAKSESGAFWRVVAGIIAAVYFAALTALLMNLIFGDITFVDTMQGIVPMLWTIIVPFNAIKAVGNAVLAYLLFSQLGRRIEV